MAKKMRSSSEAPTGDVGAGYGKRGGKGEHDYGSGHTATQSHNSYVERNQVSGPGPVEGAGEVGGAGPGRAAERYAGTASESKPREPASGSTPGGMKTIKDE